MTSPIRLSDKSGCISGPLRCLVVGLWVMLLVGIPVVAAAQAPTKDELEEFRRYVATGAEDFREGRYESALEAFRKAQDIAAPPSLSYNIGRTLQSMQRCDEAKETFEAYLDSDGLEPEDRRKAEGRIDEIEQNCRPTGTLAVDCAPADATVSVGETRKACPATFTLEEGSHEYRVTAVGFEAVVDTATVYAEERVSRSVSLPSPDAVEPAELPDGRDSGATWRRVGQFGTIIAGAGLLTAAIVTDLQADDRIAKLRDARQSGNLGRFRTLRQQANDARRRALIFYGSGAALTLAGGTWLTIDLASKKQSPASRAQLHFSLHGTAASAGIRW